MLGDDPPYLSEGTEVSAKYKGAFCEAKIRKVVRTVKCRVTYKQGLGTATVTDDQIKGTLRVGAAVEARHVDKKDFVEATITKIQDCSQYTVVFDDGDITTLRRTALCLKSGRHFAESETLDQLPLTHPEHFGNPVIGGRRGRRSRQAQDDSSEDEGSPPRGSPSVSGSGGKEGVETEPEIGRVVCVELGDKKKKDNWFPGLVVAPTAQDTVRIRVRDDYLVRSFKDARYYTVPKKEATEFTKEMGMKVENSALKVAVEKALLFLEKNELPPHWDRDSLFGNIMSSGNSDSDADLDSDSSDDEPREEKDHFVAQLYKFMDDRGTPINNCPMIGNEDVDLYRLFRAVEKLGGYNRVTNQNQWKSITRRLGISMQPTPTTHNLVKQAYKKFLHSFEDFYRKLGCTMVNHPRGSTRKQRPGRSLIRDKDRNTPVPTPQQTLPKEKEKVENEEEKKHIVEEEKVNSDVNSIPAKDIIKEEDIKIVKKRDDESVSGQESDPNVEAENAESSSSEKSQKPPARYTPVINRAKLTMKSKDEPKKKTYEKKKQESNSSSSNPSAISTSKKETSKDEETTKTRSKSKEDTKGKDSRETRTPSRESEKTRANPSKQRRFTDDDLKKQQRGRKKKEDTDKVRADKDESSGTESSSVPCYKGPVELGDKLKVYYGPTHESKVTYEAKVIDIQQVDDSSELDYLVHYTGWNTRYDEWIKATRIAQNFTQTQGRVKRTKATPRPQTPSTNLSKSTKNSNSTVQSRRRAQSVAPSSSKTSSSMTSSSSSNSFAVNNKEKDNSQLVRSTTPLSVASSSSRTKSPATPAGNRPTRNNTRNTEMMGIELRRRTRRMSGHTDLSVASESEDSDAYETDATEPERARTRSKGTEERRRREVRRRVEDRIKPDENSEIEDDKDNSDEPRRTRRLRRNLTKLQGKSEVDSGGAGGDDDEEGDVEDEDHEDNDEDENDEDEVTDSGDRNHTSEEQPKGRDFDLNQIRSELKGFDKAVKMEVIRMEPEHSGDEDTKPRVNENAQESKDEKKEIKVEEHIDVKPVVDTVSIKPDPSPSPTEDVYEFKEPEPFEFEVRNKRDPTADKDKGKKRVFDEEPKSPKKKQKVITPIPKESKSDIDTDLKRKVKRTPVKRPDENPESSVNLKINVSNPSKEFDKITESSVLNTSKTASSVAIRPSTPASTTNTIEEHVKNNTNVDIIFSDSPSNENTVGDVDDLDDRLVISETEVTEADESSVYNYQQEAFSSNETSDNKEPVKEELIQIKEEKPSVASSVISTSVVTPIAPLVTSATATTASIVEKKILETKVSVASLATTTLTTPLILAPISARLPATSSIEEKLSAAFRQSKPRDKRDEDRDTRKSSKETSKKTDAFMKRSKAANEEQNKFKYEYEKKKETEEALRKEEERSRELIKSTIKQKDDEENEEAQVKVKKEMESKKSIEVKVEHRKVIEKRDDDWKKNEKMEQEFEVSKELVESKEIEKQKRKKILSQEFVDSTDSSDSEQKLVIDNSELREERNESSSNFDVKLKAELELLQEAQQSHNQPQIPSQSLPISQQDQLINPKGLINVKTEEEGENMNLLCEEEIPGSPAPAIDITEQEVSVEHALMKNEPTEKKLVLLEMPFASAPASGTQSTSQGSLTMTVSTACGVSVPPQMPMQQNIISNPRQQQIQQQPEPQQHIPPPVVVPAQRRESNEAAPVMDNTPPDTPESTISNISGSPRGEERTGGSSPLSEDNVKLNRDSSEADNDNGGKALSGYSEDDATLNTEGTVAERTTKANKRSATEDPISPKKKKRNRKSSECGSNAGKKVSVRQSARQTRQGGAVGSDSDDTSEGSNPVISNSTSTITGETNTNGLTELSNTSRSPKPTKYNFYVELDPELDGSQRIAVLQQKLAELKKTYNLVKIELAAIERRRKKLRRREREAMKAAKAEMQQACS
ncbi:LOW QUALITY PROTEIN: AT-rich interactive domain-containing protein 4B [Chelonus insularis]|uniref:LOW QUALITY PROTEIN: AT-rich interactive domain-containing protein 4B n=1 Tax=Chelonus insularis TaxID=460826 RepID=UPI00158E0DDD|nr:LOW QUALITY PROTEIN: AT-rich interactive domain-containing protein 4B [Chelonus insularis]